MFLISINSLSDDNKQAAFFSKNYYIKIIYNNQIRVTTTKLKGNNPVWGESFMFNIDIETDNFIVQIIEINSTHEQVILKEYNIKVNYEAMRDCSKDILNFTMGNIYYDVNLKLKKLLYDFKNIKENLETLTITKALPIQSQRQPKIVPRMPRNRQEKNIFSAFWKKKP